MFKKMFLVILIFVFLGAGLFFVFPRIDFDKKPDYSSEDENIKKIKQDNADVFQKIKNDSVSGLKKISENDHVWGELNAPVELIVFSDFFCPFCLEFYDTTKKIKEKFGDKVLVVFRHYFLKSHPDSLIAAQAAECAAEQNKFWEMYNKLFEDNRENNFNKEELQKDGEEIALDIDKFFQCLESDTYKEKIESQKKEAKAAGVNGTPTVFVNNKIFPGAYPWEDFVGRDGKDYQGMESIIKQELGI